jgi:hypothetical protein
MHRHRTISVFSRIRVLVSTISHGSRCTGQVLTGPKSATDRFSLPNAISQFVASGLAVSPGSSMPR